MTKENPSFNSPKAKIQEAGMQVSAIKMFSNDKKIEEIRKIITDTNLKTLEECTGMTTEELEKIKRGICAGYNTLIEQLQDPNLSIEDFGLITEAISQQVSTSNLM